MYKRQNPTSFDQLRNISCTLLVSKIYESFLLRWTQEEVTTRVNQFGGVKGSSTEHYLLDAWEEILSGLEDHRAGIVLTSLDFSKGFNRVSHQYCLRAFADHGASSQIIRLLATFLSGRTMTVRVNESFSPVLPVSGGCPQGSLLGVFLFNVSTDNIEKKQEGIREDTETEDVVIGDFFDREDRDFLRDRESSTEPNTQELFVTPLQTPTETSEEVQSSPPGSISPASSDFAADRPLFHTSTPIHQSEDYPVYVGGSTEESTQESDSSPDNSFRYYFLPGVRNIPRTAACLSGGSDVSMDDTVPINWKDRPLKCLKYVDDCLSVEKLSFFDAVRINVDGKNLAVTKASKSQRHFDTVSINAASRGMILNAQKTKMLCISAARTYTCLLYTSPSPRD